VLWHPPFEDRADAGRKLAGEIKRRSFINPVILAIPRGGAEVGIQVARAIPCEFSLLVSRKLPFPDNPESGFGAIAEDGSVFIIQEVASQVAPERMEKIMNTQRAVIRERVKALRDDRPLPEIRDRVVILIDDGLAMGSTMNAAILLCRKKEAARIVVAVPVAGRNAIARIAPAADSLIVLETPQDFRAVAQVYRHWRDLTDEDVRLLMLGKSRRHGTGSFAGVDL